MTEIFTGYYRLEGGSFETAEALHQERETAQSEWQAFAKKHGAQGMRHARSGAFYSLILPSDTAPKGWRKLGETDDGQFEYVPHRGRREGKAAIAEIEALPTIHSYDEAIRRLSPEVASAIQFPPGMIMLPRLTRLTLPQVGYFAVIPRAAGDGLSIPADWVGLTEAEYKLAFHEHNTEVARREIENTPAAPAA